MISENIKCLDSPWQKILLIELIIAIWNLLELENIIYLIEEILFAESSRVVDS